MFRPLNSNSERFQSVPPPLLYVVEFISDNTLLKQLSPKGENGVDLVSSVVEFLLSSSKCPLGNLKILAKATDNTGRIAMDLAVPKIKAAFQARLLFLGRFDFVPGPAIHKSATCVVMRIYDMQAEVRKYLLFSVERVNFLLVIVPPSY